MADPLPSDDTDTGPEGRPPPRMPRWVKVSGIIVVLVIVAIVLAMIIGGGDHGPGRHSPGGEPAEPSEQDPPGGHEPPDGAHG